MPSMKVEGDSDGDGDMSGGDTERSGGSSRGPDRDSSAEEADEPDSDDSSEMDESECERRRNECLENLADLERQFTVLREQLYRERVNHVDYQLAEVRGGRSQEYLGPLRRLQENMRVRIEVAGILKQMRIDNIKHKFEAEEQAAHQHFKATHAKSLANPASRLKLRAPHCTLARSLTRSQLSCRSERDREARQARTLLTEDIRTSVSMKPSKKQLQPQGKAIIAGVYHRMKYEAINGVEKLTDARWRTSQAVNVSERTITNILREERLGLLASTSTEDSEETSKLPAKRRRERPKSKLNEFDTSVLRRTMMSFPTEFNEHPTLKKLKDVLFERIGFNGCIETLRRILQDAGYEWITTDDNRKILVERHDLQMLRFKYLNQIIKYREEGRYIVFTDESHVHTLQNRTWKRVQGLSPVQEDLSGAGRYVIVQAGGCDGFVPNAFFNYKVTPCFGDYNDKMNFDMYLGWLATQLLPNLPEHAVVVMHNASSRILSDKCPHPNSSKTEMHAWLKEKQIAFEESMKKVELYDLIATNKDRFKCFTIDKLIRSKGFEVVRMPPCHPELNPVEQIWEMLKNYVGDMKTGQNLESIMTLIQERTNMIDATTWKNTCRHVEDVEKQYMKYFEMDNECILGNANDSGADENESDESVPIGNFILGT